VLHTTIPIYQSYWGLSIRLLSPMHAPPQFMLTSMCVRHDYEVRVEGERA
jgi:hypothetical protein